jgi:uncharacterized protein (DUF362 family)
MPKRHSCGGVNRRHFLASAVAAAPALACLRATAQEPKAADPQQRDGSLGVPGPYPGRVIEVRNPSMIKDGAKSQQAIRESLSRGMKELTGADEAVDAWRTFFQPGDVVGIKVVPNGYPYAHTSPEMVLEVIEALKAAGVKLKDMVVFDRYRAEFIEAKYPEALPDGLLWGGLTSENDSSQLRLKFSGDDPVAGYDPDQFMQMNLIHYGHDPKDDRNLRSHLGLLVTKRLNKLVMLPCLKDHGSAGSTGALKNMSHGLVNNVARSHSTPSTNACNQFIPQVVAHPIIRQKCVLHIMDGTRGVFQGGPFARRLDRTWEYNALLFATDPVAMDHVEWDIIDAKRKEMHLPGVGAVGRLAEDPFGTEGYDVRQPQHIPLAANLGLGIFDYRSPRGRKQSIEHRVIELS